MSKDIIKLLKEEIEWGKKHYKDEKEISDEFKKGFIKGLRHAIRLIQLTNGK